MNDTSTDDTEAEGTATDQTLARRTGAGAARPGGHTPRPSESRTRAAMDLPRRGSDTPASEKSGRVLTVGPDIELDGKISSCDRLIVEGRVKAEQSEIKYIDVATGGSFKGSAMVEEADISGTFDGDLVATNRVTIHAGGRVNGNVTYGKIIIEEGGIVIGALNTTDA